MRHGKEGRKFHRKQGQRKSFLKGLTANLIMEGRIQTTEARAKEIKPRVERLITIGKRQNVASLRLLLSRLPKPAAMKLYHEVAPRFIERHGGYTRIIKGTRSRMRDGASRSIIEFVL